MKHKILLVDNERVLLDLLEGCLYDEFEVISASNAEKALQIFEEDGDIELVVSDINMPGKNGLDLLKEIKEKKPGFPVILMSGNPDSLVEATEKSPPPDFTILKLFKVEELIKKIEKVFCK
jgi:DNA-binding NtrC family response regulator